MISLDKGRIRLLRLTLPEARWLHANRHLDIAHEIVRVKNLVQLFPLDAAARIRWNETLEKWRASEQHPSFDAGDL